jgi:hypothetical protein
MTPRLPAKPGRLSDAISSHLHKESRPSLHYTNASVIVTPDTTYRGLDEIRGFFRRFLDSATPEFWDALCRRWGSDGESRRLTSRCVACGISAAPHERPLNRMIASWKSTEHCVIGAGLQGEASRVQASTARYKRNPDAIWAQLPPIVQFAIADAEAKRLTRHPREAVAPVALGTVNYDRSGVSQRLAHHRLPPETSAYLGRHR